MEIEDFCSYEFYSHESEDEDSFQRSDGSNFDPYSFDLNPHINQLSDMNELREDLIYCSVKRWGMILLY